MAKVALVSLALLIAFFRPAHKIPAPSEIDVRVNQVMTETSAQGMAIAVIDNGRINYIKAYGIRNVRNEPLTNDTVMYGASLTKSVFAALVMQLADEGKIDLDASIANYLPQPLPRYNEDEKYADYTALAGDERWRKLTPRILLTHSSGFSNFGFLEPDGRLKFHFDPGSRYAYSGDGIILLQFVLEKGLGLDVGAELQNRFFAPNNMRKTSLIWRPDFNENLADGWDDVGATEVHDERSKVRAAGSMDTTIADFANFTAAFINGNIISTRLRRQMTRPQLKITTKTQFPSLQDELPIAEQRQDIAAGLGVIAFNGPQGPGFYKGGHNNITANTWVCIERRRRCVVILANDVRAEKGFTELVTFILGDTGVPFDWEYGDYAGKS
ncbi:MAG: beta-lactamase [Hyphomonadaceae bacterium]|nr:MAG: beta-lactamase [Hyphomonadaceae bacterium]KAF0185016.1 MAG: beta-lactamase [Hyphomonadaceae bacterium]